MQFFVCFFLATQQFRIPLFCRRSLLGEQQCGESVFRVRLSMCLIILYGICASFSVAVPWKFLLQFRVLCKAWNAIFTENEHEASDKEREIERERARMHNYQRVCCCTLNLCSSFLDDIIVVVVVVWCMHVLPSFCVRVNFFTSVCWFIVLFSLFFAFSLPPQCGFLLLLLLLFLRRFLVFVYVLF